MANIFDYLAWRGDLPLEVSPFNSVDGVILARLAYLPFGAVLPDEAAACSVQDAAQAILAAPECFFNESDVRLLEQLSQSPRFRDLQLTGFVDLLDEETQFCALTIRLDPNNLFLSFRGTDNTLVGWKEDFNMSFVCPVPAQTLALAYLGRTAARLTGAIRMGGHSKGGNLAVYAGAFCGEAIQNRIVEIYNYDGPGFDQQVLDDPGYDAICQRVQTFVPKSSVVGMMLGHEEQYTIVDSSQMGVMQHNIYSWDVYGPDFVRLEQVNNSSRFMDFTLKAWLRDMAPAQREVFFDAVYRILEQTNAKTFREVTENLPQNAVIIAKTVKNLDEDTRKAVTHALGLLFKSARTGLSQMIQNR